MSDDIYSDAGREAFARVGLKINDAAEDVTVIEPGQELTDEQKASWRAGNRTALLAKLRELRHLDPESGHMDADAALLDFIADDEIRAAFDEICKWYS